MDKLAKVTGEYTVESIIESMKKINESNSLIYSYGSVLNQKFILYAPCTDKEIRKLKKAFHYRIPADYLSFLQLTNGLQLTQDARLINADEIIDCQKAFPYPDNIMVIGQCFCADIEILINLKQSNSNCVFITESIGSEYAYGSHLSFIDFLNIFVSCYGAAFWDWSIDYDNKICLGL